MKRDKVRMRRTFAIILWCCKIRIEKFKYISLINGNVYFQLNKSNPNEVLITGGHHNYLVLKIHLCAVTQLQGQVCFLYKNIHSVSFSIYSKPQSWLIEYIPDQDIKKFLAPKQELSQMIKNFKWSYPYLCLA